MLKTFATLAAAMAAVALSAAATRAQTAPDVAAVVKTYADIAEAGYADSLAEAQELKEAVETLVKEPNEDNLAAAREAWRAARVPYMQTEAFRFGNAIVDDWEGKVNAWPLDEGLIDYVSAEYGDQSPENDLYVANVIANTSIKIAGEAVDTSRITKELLADKLQEAGGVESNVATGYHAIEFLLWGQDLNGTGPGAGKRPATDFDPKKCTGGHCERRAQYLATVTDLLVQVVRQLLRDTGAGDAPLRRARHGERGLRGELRAEHRSPRRHARAGDGGPHQRAARKRQEADAVPGELLGQHEVVDVYQGQRKLAPFVF